MKMWGSLFQSYSRSSISWQPSQNPSLLRCSLTTRVSSPRSQPRCQLPIMELICRSGASEKDQRIGWESQRQDKGQLIRAPPDMLWGKGQGCQGLNTKMLLSQVPFPAQSWENCPRFHSLLNLALNPRQSPSGDIRLHKSLFWGKAEVNPAGDGPEAGGCHLPPSADITATGAHLPPTVLPIRRIVLGDFLIRGRMLSAD